MKVFLLVAFLCILPLINSTERDIDDETSLKCIAFHLKNMGFLGAKDETPKELSETCAYVIEVVRGRIAEKYRKKFSFDQEQAKSSDCLVEYLNKTDVFDRYMIKFMDFSKAKVGLETMAKNHYMSGLKSSLEVMKAQQSCDLGTVLDQKVFDIANEDFDGLFEENYLSGLRSDEVDYCVRKHLKKSLKQHSSLEVCSFQ
jgi:hypothetical protein